MDREQEVELIERAQAGDQAAWSALWEQFKNLIWKWSIANTARGFDLDDSVSIASEQFVNAVRAFDPSLGTRLSTITVPRIQWNIGRGFRGGPVHLPQTVSGGPRPTVPIEPQFHVVSTDGDRVIEREEHELLEAALKQLPERLRDMLLMRTHGFTLKEIADNYSITGERVRVLLNRAIARLRQLCRVA